MPAKTTTTVRPGSRAPKKTSAKNGKGREAKSTEAAASAIVKSSTPTPAATEVNALAKTSFESAVKQGGHKTAFPEELPPPPEVITIPPDPGAPTEARLDRLSSDKTLSRPVEIDPRAVAEKVKNDDIISTVELLADIENTFGPDAAELYEQAVIHPIDSFRYARAPLDAAARDAAFAWRTGGWMTDDFGSVVTPHPFDKEHPRVNLRTGRSAIQPGTWLSPADVSYRVANFNNPEGMPFRLPKLTRIETYPGSGDYGVFISTQRGELLDITDWGSSHVLGSHRLPSTKGVLWPISEDPHARMMYYNWSNFNYKRRADFPLANGPIKMLPIRFADPQIRDSGATSEVLPSIGGYPIRPGTTIEEIVEQLRGVLLNDTSRHLAATDLGTADLIIYDGSKLNPEKNLSVMAYSGDGYTPMLSHVLQWHQYADGKSWYNSSPGASFHETTIETGKPIDTVDAMDTAVKEFQQNPNGPAADVIADFTGRYFDKSSFETDTPRFNRPTDDVRQYILDISDIYSPPDEHTLHKVLNDVEGPIGSYYAELKPYEKINDADHFVFRRSEFVKLPEQEQRRLLREAVTKGLFALPLAGATASPDAEDTRQDAKGGESARRKLPVFQGPPDISMFIDPRSLRSYRADAKGGREQMASFLATDDVPDTLFGIPIVSRPEQYTQEDIEFFEDHPDAGGYYDLGDEQESEEPMEEPPMEEMNNA